MCEILLRVKHSASAVDKHHVSRTQAGDVIVVLPDGNGWGTKEIENREWRILQMPELPVEALNDMLQDGPATSRGVKTRRARYFDLEALPWLREAMATAQALKLTHEETQLLLKAKRTRTHDFTVIG